MPEQFRAQRGEDGAGWRRTNPCCAALSPRTAARRGLKVARGPVGTG
jgi:hypothetical protein